MLWACIRLPQLALDAALRKVEDPQRPLALVSGPAQLRRLHAVNPAAAAAGLQPGMRLAAAHALLADITLVEHDPAEEQRWHRFLAAWAYRHSSQVSAQWPGTLLLEAQASFRLFGPWPRFQQRLREELTALGFQHRIALAPVPAAARVFADLRDGFALMQPEPMRQALAQVPVRAAQLPEDAGPRLQRMGLRTLGALRAMPRDGLRRRFGAALLLQLDQLHGDADAPLQLYAPPDRFDARIELGFEVEQHQALLFPLQRLLGDLALFLSVRDGGVQRFVLRLEHERDLRPGHADARRWTDVEVGLLAPEREAKMLFELTRHRLQQVPIPRAVVALRLLARELPPFVPAERDLFDRQLAHATPWPQLRERLRARLGDDAVYRLDDSHDPRPERSWRRVVGDGRLPGATVVIDPERPQPLRPGWLLQRPVPLRDPRPQVCSGPERLESGWWDGADARRDYYVVRTSQGQLAWAFAPVGEQGSWMLQGWFA